MNGSDGNVSAGFARYLSIVDVWAIAFGCMIGWGAFVIPGSTFLPTAGLGGTLLAMAISAAVMLVIGVNFSFLMRRRPVTGGVYAFTKEGFGRDHAFLCAWFLSLSYISIVCLNATALTTLSHALLADALRIGPHYRIGGYDIYLTETAISIAVLAVVGWLFIGQKPLLQRLQTALAAALLLGVAVIAAVCLPRLRVSGPGAELLRGNGGGAGMLAIVLLAPWAFIGFDIISLETVHFAFPVRRSGRIITASILLGALVYAAMSLVSVTAVPEGFGSWMEYADNLGRLSGIESVPAFYAAQSALGGAGTAILGVAALAAVLTGVIGAFRAAARMLATLAEDHILSDRFSNTTFSALFIFVLCSAITLLGHYALDWFMELTTFGAVVGFGYASASAYRLAKSEHHRPVMLTGAAGTAITAIFAAVQLVPKLTPIETLSAESFLTLALWCLMGFVFYWRTMRRSMLSDYNGGANSSTLLFALLLYSALMWFILRLMDEIGASEFRRVVAGNAALLIALVGVGLVVMLYIQNTLRRRHEALEREKIRAEESSRAKSRFLFGISHDIRTPMNAIMGFARLARQKDVTAKEKDAFLHKIEASGEQLLELINDVLDASSIESGKLELHPERVSLRALTEAAGDIFAGQMQDKGISFTSEIGVEDEWVLCDKNAVRRVLMNLLSNACKYTPSGGAVLLRLTQTGRDGDSASYELLVRDTGVGMDPAFLKDLFTPFEREKSQSVQAVQGTGLGMSITKSLIELMGGQIDVDTRPGEGTGFTVRLTLPVAATEPAEGGSARDTAALVGKRILLAEDNAINREIASMLLSQAGVELETAENGKLAVDMIRQAPPGHFDLVLMDIRMPVMDGYTAAGAIRALDDPERAGVPIVAMSANTIREDEPAAADAGMQAYIEKPIDPGKMFKTLAEVLLRHENHIGE